MMSLKQWCSGWTADEVAVCASSTCPDLVKKRGWRFRTGKGLDDLPTECKGTAASGATKSGLVHFTLTTAHDETFIVFDGMSDVVMPCWDVLNTTKSGRDDVLFRTEDNDPVDGCFKTSWDLLQTALSTELPPLFSSFSHINPPLCMLVGVYAVRARGPTTMGDG